MKKIILAMLDGTRTGALAYLLVLAFEIQPAPVTSRQICSFLVMSALIGVVSLCFEMEGIPYFLLFLGHFFLTATLVVLTMAYNGWGHYVFQGYFQLVFLLIYACVWLSLLLINHLRTRQINAALIERKKQQ